MKLPNIKEILARYRRVIMVARKPSLEELNRTARVCGFGILFMGFVAFIFYIISIIGGGI